MLVPVYSIRDLSITYLLSDCENLVHTQPDQTMWTSPVSLSTRIYIEVNKAYSVSKDTQHREGRSDVPKTTRDVGHVTHDCTW